jgi:hypothetical protein
MLIQSEYLLAEQAEIIPCGIMFNLTRCAVTSIQSLYSTHMYFESCTLENIWFLEEEIFKCLDIIKQDKHNLEVMYMHDVIRYLKVGEIK